MPNVKRSYQNCLSKFSPRKVAKLRYVLQTRVNKEGDCLVWAGAFTRRPNGKPAFGYVRIVEDGKSKTFSVHRLAYQLFVGDLEFCHVLHSCDNPLCVNPKHLRQGTHQENMQDMVDRDRHATKIPRSEVPRIAALLELGVPQRLIAKAWCVSETTISLLKDRAYFKKYSQPQAAKEPHANS